MKQPVRLAVIGVAIALFNKDKVAAWPDDVRDGAKRAIRAATLAQRGFADEDDRICADKMIAEGVEIHELDAAGRAAFVEATKDDVAITRSNFSAELVDLFDSNLSGS